MLVYFRIYHISLHKLNTIVSKKVNKSKVILRLANITHAG